MNLATKRLISWLHKALYFFTPLHLAVFLPQLFSVPLVFAEELPSASLAPHTVSFSANGALPTLRFKLIQNATTTTDSLPVRSFLLPNPPRFVVDLLSKSVSLAPEGSASHSKLRSVRWGEHADYRRLVLDLTELPLSVVTQTTAAGFFGELRFADEIALGEEFDSSSLTVSKRDISFSTQEQSIADTVVTNSSTNRRSFSIALEQTTLDPTSSVDSELLRIAPRNFHLEPGGSQTIRLVSAAEERNTERSFRLRIFEAAAQESTYSEVAVRLLPTQSLERVRLSEIGHTLHLVNEGTVRATISGTICATAETSAEIAAETECSELPPTVLLPNLSLMVQRAPASQFNGKIRFDNREELIRYPES